MLFEMSEGERNEVNRRIKNHTWNCSCAEQSIRLLYYVKPNSGFQALPVH